MTDRKTAFAQAATSLHRFAAILAISLCLTLCFGFCLSACVPKRASTASSQSGAIDQSTQPTENTQQAPANGDAVNETLKVKGTVKDGIVSYKGIPYAAPPVGELRFCPPQAATPWTEVLDCTQFRHSAVQVAGGSNNDAGVTPDEDCLYLNIWAPEGAEGKKLPVYFWIHGGAYVQGAGSNVMYDGSDFAADDVIVVTINYRLGALGYLGFQTLLDQYGTTGNWGTLDQIAALAWVHSNIAAFGGDPANITIGGESAGAFSVSNLIMSPLTDGLFARAIMESGSLLSNQAIAPFTRAELDKTIAMSQEYAAQFGASDSAEGLEVLRSIDAKTLCSMAPFSMDVSGSVRYSFWPAEDGYVIPEDPLVALEEGTYNKVPVLMGCVKDEGSVFIPDTITQAGFEKYVYQTFKGDKARLVLDYYSLPAQTSMTPVEKARDVAGMAMFKAGMAYLEDELSKAGLAVYVYQFNYDPPGTDDGLGVRHSVEVPFVFGTAKECGLGLDAVGEKIEMQTHSLWSNFITSGNPNTGITNLPYKVAWPDYDYIKPQIYNIQDNIAVTGREQDETVEFFKYIMFG